MSAALVTKPATDNPNDSADKFVTWTAATLEKKEKQLVAIVKPGPKQTTRMLIVYAAMGRMAMFSHPRFLEGGLVFFRDALLILWREFATDAHSSGDYKRGKFVDDLERETRKMITWQEQADHRWKQAADLDRHNRELLDNGSLNSPLN